MEKVPVSIFTFNELHTIGVRFLEIVEPLNKDVFVHGTANALEEQLNILAKVLGKSPDHSLTQQLAEKDFVRDKSFVALRDLAKAHSERVKQKSSEAGETLTKIFKEVGYTLHRDGYSTQTSKLMVLFKELEGKKALKALKTIDGELWLDDLIQAQKDFENAYEKKIESGQSNDNYPKKVVIRRAIDRYMEGIYSYISLNSDSHSETFGPVLNKLEEMINEANRIARARKTRKKNASDDLNIVEESPEPFNVLTEFNSDINNISDVE